MSHDDCTYSNFMSPWDPYPFFIASAHNLINYLVVENLSLYHIYSPRERRQQIFLQHSMIVFF